MKIAVQGCCHGELEALYATLAETQERLNETIDLLVICGDFQATRSTVDLEALACPPKYRALGVFWEYYAGLKEAPISTIFIGGNHEASHFLWELYHGGWVAPNIYFLGFAGVVNFGGLRIGGLSGIYKPHHYNKGFFERQPLNDSDARSIYHVREYNASRLLQIRDPIDIFISHDWPRGIALHGDFQKLLRAKPFLKGEIHDNSLGSLPGELILKKLRPAYWFSAHLHVKFAALYAHSQTGGVSVANPDEIMIEDSDEDEEDFDVSVKENAMDEMAPPTDNKPTHTQFLALDKILPGRPFLQILDFPDSDSPKEFVYDEEWLAIVKATADGLSLSRSQRPLPSEADLESSVQTSRQWVKEHVSFDTNNMRLPPFIMTAPVDDPTNSTRPVFSTYINPQTSHLCRLLDIPNVINPDGKVVEYPGQEVEQALDKE